MGENNFFPGPAQLAMMGKADRCTDTDAGMQVESRQKISHQVVLEQMLICKRIHNILVMSRIKWIWRERRGIEFF